MSNVDNLVLEHLKAIRADLGTVKNDVRDLVHRVGRVEVSLAGLRRDLANNDEGIAEHSVRMDRLSERIDRIERRLDLTETPAS